VIELSNGDITSGLRRPLAAEIDNSSLLTSQNTQDPFSTQVEQMIGSMVEYLSTCEEQTNLTADMAATNVESRCLYTVR
jgi:hypothetical protein